MKLTKNSKSFEPCPEFSGQAVVVDVTQLKKVETAYGPKETFKIVFETPLLRQDGTPYCVWSRGFTPSLHEKAAFAQFLRKWFGRALTAAEEAEFDTENLLGKTAEITVVHEEGRTGEVYANIALIRPDKTGKAITPSGKFKRVKDREQNNGASDAEYRRAEQADDPGDAPIGGAPRFTSGVTTDSISATSTVRRWPRSSSAGSPRRRRKPNRSRTTAGSSPHSKSRRRNSRLLPRSIRTTSPTEPETTAMILIKRESASHWYLRDGTPFHETERADGKGLRRSRSAMRGRSAPTQASPTSSASSPSPASTHGR